MVRFGLLATTPVVSLPALSPDIGEGAYARVVVVVPLSLGDEAVMITSGEYCEFDGTLVILKVGKNLKEIKEKVLASGRNAFLVENCGMENERIFYDLKSIPDEAGYFSVLIVK